MSQIPPENPPDSSPSQTSILRTWSTAVPDGQPSFSSTVIVKGSASEEERDQKIGTTAAQGGVIEYCPKCGAALDVSGCFPLSMISCPDCSERMKVLERFGHYLLLSVLGQGGMGCVCRAFDRNLERDVALKMIRNEYMSSPAYITQLLDEAKCMALVAHPNVVRVYSTGLENGIYYIAMEIVNGGTVANLMNHKRLSEPMALNLAIQAGEGLSAAFRAGLLHRDIKPGNFLLTGAGEIKVADFGLALTMQQASTYDGDVWGTPEYVSPEKITKTGEDVRSDIYSLGATIYHIVTGHRPFEGKTASEIALKHLENRPLPVQTWAPDISDETSRIIAQMLEKDPATRQQSYDELLDQLRSAQANLARGVTGRQQIRESLHLQEAEEQKSSALVATMTLGVVLALGLSVFFISRKNRFSGSDTVAVVENRETSAPKPLPTKSTPRNTSQPLLDSQSTTPPLTSSSPVSSRSPEGTDAPTNLVENFEKQPDASWTGQWLGPHRMASVLVERNGQNVPMILISKRQPLGEDGSSPATKAVKNRDVVTLTPNSIVKIKYRTTYKELTIFAQKLRGGVRAGNIAYKLSNSEVPDAEGWRTASIPISEFAITSAIEPKGSGPETLKHVTITTWTKDQNCEIAEFSITSTPSI